MSQYVHHVPGRLRLRFAHWKRNKTLVHSTQRFVQDLKGVEQVQPNALTGSITIGFDPSAICPQTIVESLYAERYIYQRVTVPKKGVRSSINGTLSTSIAKAVFGILAKRAVKRASAALIAALL